MDYQIVSSKAEEATVFFRGAELVHTAKATLAKGANEVWIDGLSTNVDRNSIKIKTTGNVVVSSFEFSINYLTPKLPDAQAQQLENELKQKQKEAETLASELKINGNLLSILQKSVEKKASGSQDGLSIDELIKTMDYYHSKAGELEKAISLGKEKHQQIKQSILDLTAQLKQEALDNKASGVIKLALSAPVEGVCNFTVSYYTSSAGWTPYHDIQVAGTNQSVRIVSKAKVKQVTGIDWKKVRISLSTAVPSADRVAPLFSAWFLQYVEPIHLMVTSDAMMQNSYSYAEEEMAAPIMAMEAGEEDSSDASPLYVVDGVAVDAEYYATLDRQMIKSTKFLDASQAMKQWGQAARGGAVVANLKSSMEDFITQSENQLNVTYDIDMPYTIPGNGKEQSIDLKSQEAPASFKYYCAPKLDSETYLLAEIADWEKLNLLSGPANITYDNTYVGETYIDAASTHTNLSLTLGTDKRVAAKREKLKDFSSTGFLGNDVKQEFAWQLTVRNNRNQAIKMVLKDQYPISTMKEVTVELSKNTTAPSFNKEDVGVLTWEKEIQPGETQTYQLIYTVKYPKGKKINF
ncbi:MAG: DUF4139 domain-containing protein [Bacteroidales bacterium]|nr:DUF4139 domain-containing protein [Bacteroidales bacterium]